MKINDSIGVALLSSIPISIALWSTLYFLINDYLFIKNISKATLITALIIGVIIKGVVGDKNFKISEGNNLTKKDWIIVSIICFFIFSPFKQ